MVAAVFKPDFLAHSSGDVPTLCSSGFAISGRAYRPNQMISGGSNWSSQVKGEIIEMGGSERQDENETHQLNRRRKRVRHSRGEGEASLANSALVSLMCSNMARRASSGLRCCIAEKIRL